jgi:hypothetical protein
LTDLQNQRTAQIFFGKYFGSQWPEFIRKSEMEIEGDAGMSSQKELQEEKRDQHIKEMKEQLRLHLNQPENLFLGEFKSLKEEEAFLEHILFMEGVGEQPLFDALERGGIQLPPAASMDDERLKTKLWEVINAMALLGNYLERTDHLSDRQLYELLWTELLREPASICPNNPNAACHIDILGGCSEEDLMLNLKYYADEEERFDWAEEFHGCIIPPHEPLPFDRDRYLPAPPDAYTRRMDAS